MSESELNSRSPAQSSPILGANQYMAFEREILSLLRPRPDAGECDYAFICGVEATLRALRNFR